MDTHCSMHSMKESTGSGHEDMKVAPCHTGGERLSGGCCDPESISPPVVGKTERASALPAALEVDGRGVLAPPASVELGTQTEPPRSRLHDLGRYTLFSALLL